HDVTAFGYDSDGVWIATWGGKRLIAWDAFTSTRWLEECYAQLAPLWYANAKLAPCGVDAAALQADLAKLAGGTIPSIDPTPTPPVPPVPVPPAPPVYSSYAGTAALSGTIRMPFGGTQALSLSGPVSLAPVASLARIVDRVGLEDPALHFNLGLLLQIIAAVAPVIAADIAAGKSIVEMLPDIAAALLPLLSRG